VEAASPHARARAIFPEATFTLSKVQSRPDYAGEAHDVVWSYRNSCNDEASAKEQFSVEVSVVEYSSHAVEVEGPKFI